MDAYEVLGSIDKLKPIRDKGLVSHLDSMTANISNPLAHVNPVHMLERSNTQLDVEQAVAKRLQAWPILENGII